MTCEPTESSALPGTPGTYTHTLARLIQLARQPAWKAWAWSYAKKLDSEPSRYFKGMADDLKAAMTGPEKVSESVVPSSEKPP